MRRIRLICLLTALAMSVLVCSPACALDPSTLCNGSRGDDVRRLQQALIQLGFLSGSADGVFGNKTEEAVRIGWSGRKKDAGGTVCCGSGQRFRFFCGSLFRAGRGFFPFL